VNSGKYLAAIAIYWIVGHWKWKLWRKNREQY